MRWRHLSCALIVLFSSFVAARADVTYSYQTGTAFFDQTGTTGVNTFTDQFNASNQPTNVSGGFATGVAPNWSNLGTAPAGTTVQSSGVAYTGTAGQQISIPIYLVETVNNSATQGALSTNTSIINRYFINSPSFSQAFVGLASASFSVEQTGAAQASSGSPVVSQILGGQVTTPSSIPAVPNTPGFTFGRGWTASFTSSSSASTSAPGGPWTERGATGVAQLYSNITDNTAGAVSGNNLQVSTHLNTNTSLTAASANNGVLTDAPFQATSGTTGVYQTGKILIGIMNLTIGNGFTTFNLGYAGNANLVGTLNTKYDGDKKITTGVATPLSGKDSAGKIKSDTLLVMNAFSDGTSGNSILDYSYNSGSTQKAANSGYDTWTSFLRFNAGDDAIAGPDAAGASPKNSFIPYYASNSTPFLFTVGTETPAVPEPSSMALCGLLTALGTGYAVKRRRKLAAQAIATV